MAKSATLFNRINTQKTYIVCWSTGDWSYDGLFHSYDPIKFLNRLDTLSRMVTIDSENIFQTMAAVNRSKFFDPKSPFTARGWRGENYIVEIDLSRENFQQWKNAGKMLQIADRIKRVHAGAHMEAINSELYRPVLVKHSLGKFEEAKPQKIPQLCRAY
jgi:hypothetical protein